MHVVNFAGTLGQTILCFSLKRNMKKISDTRGLDALGCVHGLRVFSLVWVIAGHTCMITVPFVGQCRTPQLHFLFPILSLTNYLLQRCLLSSS